MSTKLPWVEPEGAEEDGMLDEAGICAVAADNVVESSIKQSKNAERRIDSFFL
jgi:hypothetical protein